MWFELHLGSPFWYAGDMNLEMVLGRFGWTLGAPVGRWKKHVFGSSWVGDANQQPMWFELHLASPFWYAGDMILEMVLGRFGWRLGAPVGRWKKHVFGSSRVCDANQQPVWFELPLGSPFWYAGDMILEMVLGTSWEMEKACFWQQLGLRRKPTVSVV